ncbi:hypothetical protein [Robertkochia solimangrovi]|uniref:hypothetical protein n=1 Tax=Robertkochia solimangrovi TaxID=2213046 RepID=UPI0013A56A68|nr:hypothetical protein [Robertkochia solimangrovi]
MKKLIFVFVLMASFNSLTSCTTESVSEQDALYNAQADGDSGENGTLESDPDEDDGN